MKSGSPFQFVGFQFFRLLFLGFSFALTGCLFSWSPAAVQASQPTDEMSTAKSVALQAILGDAPYRQAAWELRGRAKSLPAHEQFQLLKQFVLPADGNTIRFDYEFSPTHPAGKLADGSTGGKLVAPVLDLIQAASKAGELSGLQQQVASLPLTDLLSNRKRLATLIMIASTDNRSAEALSLLDEFNRLSPLEQSLTSETIAPDLILLHFLKDFPEAYDTFLPNADRIVKSLRTSRSDGVWGRGFRNLRGLQATAPRSIAPLASSAQWHTYTQILAETRGQGLPHARWSLYRGRADNVASHGHDFLCFASPISGDFQIECDATLFDWSETRIFAKGFWFNPIYDYEHYQFGGIATGFAQNPITPPLTRMQNTMHLRTAVRGDQLSAYVNGRLIHQQIVPEHSDPWIGIRCGHVQEGSAFDVRISGNVSIPDTIQLTAGPRLEGWIPYFGDVVGMANSFWRHPPNGLQGLQRTDGINRIEGLNSNEGLNSESSSFEENAIFYHRPIMEDGTIEYEFFFEHDRMNASPVLDRLCLRPNMDGVHTHWLTDGRFDRTQTAPDNDAIETECQSYQGQLPLRNGEWNSAAVRVQGDVAELLLNGKVVFRRTLEPTNQRYFGFFYYADQEELQVRNVRWTGNWPKTLPSVQEQELAAFDQQIPEPSNSPFAASFEHNFATAGVDSGRFAMIHGNQLEDIQQEPDGTLMQVSGTGGYRNTTIAPQIAVDGDFDIVAEYDRFETNPPPKGSSSLTLNLKFQTLVADEAAVSRRHMHDTADAHRQILQCIAVSRYPEGEKREHFVTRNTEDRSGRLRISRRGRQVYYLSAEGDSPHERLWGSREITDAPVDLNGIRLQTQIHETGTTSVVWKTLRVHADRITGIGPGAENRLLTEINQKRDELPSRFLFDFTKLPPNPNNLYRWMDTRPWTESALGLEILSQGSDSWLSAGISTLQPFRGDFDFESQLSDIKLGQPTKGQGSGVFLQADFADPLDTQISVIYSLNDAGTYEFGGQIRTRKPNGEFAYHKFASLNTISPASSLRMARIGDSLTVLVRGNEQDSELILGRIPITDADVSSAKVLLHTGGDGRQSQMLLKSLHIHAQEYHPLE